MQALVSLTAKGLAPNLQAVVSGTLPDEQSGKVWLSLLPSQEFLPSGLQLAVAASCAPQYIPCTQLTLTC